MSSSSSNEPGARSNADFIRPGVIYGYRACGDYGDDRNIYYFGRTKQAVARACPVSGEGIFERQKLVLKNRCRRVGLNTPSSMLIWWRAKRSCSSALLEGGGRRQVLGLASGAAARVVGGGSAPGAGYAVPGTRRP